MLKGEYKPSLVARARPMVADARAQPFPSNFFDVVTSNYGFSHILGYSKALSETYRTLKPGGWLIVRQGFGLARYPRTKELLKGFTVEELIRLHKFGDVYVGKESFIESVRNHGFLVVARAIQRHTGIVRYDNLPETTVR